MIDMETRRRRVWIRAQSLDSDLDLTIRAECLRIRQEATRQWMQDRGIWLKQRRGAQTP